MGAQGPNTPYLDSSVANNLLTHPTYNTNNKSDKNNNDQGQHHTTDVYIQSVYMSFSFTGIDNHDPCRLKAPVFSFGTRHGLIGADCSPGPRYLVPANITRVGRSGTPAFSLYGRHKEPTRFQIPGPGQKNP